MKSVLPWLIRIFGGYVLIRGCWLLSAEGRVHAVLGGLQPHRGHPLIGETLDLAISVLFQAPFLLALSGLVIVMVAFRR
jgi:hypothetical protein